MKLGEKQLQATRSGVLVETQAQPFPPLRDDPTIFQQERLVYRHPGTAGVGRVPIAQNLDQPVLDVIINANTTLTEEGCALVGYLIRGKFVGGMDAGPDEVAAVALSLFRGAILGAGRFRGA